MTEEFCKKLSIADIFNMKVNPDGKETSTPLDVTIGTVKNYNYMGDFDENLIEDADPVAL
jgi:hypothetical protein